MKSFWKNLTLIFYLISLGANAAGGKGGSGSETHGGIPKRLKFGALAVQLRDALCALPKSLWDEIGFDEIVDEKDPVKTQLLSQEKFCKALAKLDIIEKEDLIASTPEEEKRWGGKRPLAISTPKVPVITYSEKKYDETLDNDDGIRDVAQVCIHEQANISDAKTDRLGEKSLRAIEILEKRGTIKFEKRVAKEQSSRVLSPSLPQIIFEEHYTDAKVGLTEEGVQNLCASVAGAYESAYVYVVCELIDKNWKVPVYGTDYEVDPKFMGYIVNSQSSESMSFRGGMSAGASVSGSKSLLWGLAKKTYSAGAFASVGPSFSSNSSNYYNQRPVWDYHITPVTVLKGYESHHVWGIRIYGIGDLSGPEKIIARSDLPEELHNPQATAREAIQRCLRNNRITKNSSLENFLNYRSATCHHLKKAEGVYYWQLRSTNPLIPGDKVI
jgi:hypothetical protein